MFAYLWAFVLLPLPLLVWWWLPPYRESREGLRVPFLTRLAQLTGQTPTTGAVVLRSNGWRTGLMMIVWFCLVTTLARPQWLEPPVSRTVPVRDMMLAVDLSGSMQTRDFTDATGQTVDRLTAVQQVLDNFLARRHGDRVGLIVFGNSPFVQVPFTQDLHVCRELLSETRVGMAGPRTALGDAIGLAITRFAHSDMPEKVLMVLTDGNDTGSQVPPRKAAAVAKDQAITIFTVAVGDPKAAGEDPLDEDTLRDVAATTGGRYSHASDRAELDAIYQRLDELPTRKAETISHRLRRDLFPYPLAVAFGLSFLPAIIGLVRARFRQPVPIAPAHATGGGGR